MKARLVATILLIPLLCASCSEYRTAGYATARVHVKNAPASLDRHRNAPPRPQRVQRTAAPTPHRAPIAPQAVPAQGPIPENLLAPRATPVAAPTTSPAPVAAPAAPAKPKRDYAVMPGQNRRLKTTY